MTCCRLQATTLERERFLAQPAELVERDAMSAETLAAGKGRLSFPSRVAKSRLAAAFGAMLAWGLCGGIDPAAAVPSASDEPITPINAIPKLDPAQVALGQALFNDPRLSGNGTSSCQSCHDLRTNGATGRAHDLAPDGTPIKVNTDTVFNAALSFRLNWKGDAHSLQEQAAMAIERRDIMAGDPNAVVSRLRADPLMRKRFMAAFNHDPDWNSTLDALAAFEETLLTPGSRFDRWLQGDRDAMSADEVSGYELFKSIGCAACHQGINLGGNLFEAVGVAGHWPSGRKTLRVPSLRNVAATPPYFDDGSAPTLPVAVRRMAAGQLGLNLDDGQIRSIVTFLDTLNGTYDGHPVVAPR
jgi:cytochrome c peroxidase